MAKAIEPELMRRLINMADWMQGLGSEGQPMHVVLHTDEPIDINDATPGELPLGGNAVPLAADWGLITRLRATPPQGYVTAPMTFDRDPGMDLQVGLDLPMAPLTTVIRDGDVLDELIAQVALDRTQPYWADGTDMLDHTSAWLSSLKDSGWTHRAGESIGDFIGRQAKREAEAEAAMRPQEAEARKRIDEREHLAENGKRDAHAMADDLLDAAIVSGSVHRRVDVIRIARAIRDAGRLTDTEAAHLTRLIAAGNRPEETQ